MSLIPQKVQSIFTSSSSHPLHSLSNQSIAILSFGSIVFINVALAAYRDYKIYLSYGPGGLPYNLRGWFISSCILRPWGTEVFSTGLYDRNPDKRKWLSSDWPPYERGQRPRLGPHPLPQRQLDQLTDEGCKELLKSEFNKLVAANPSIIQFRPSLHEGHTRSIFLADDVPGAPVAKEMLREVSHIHATGDYSVHVVLAPQDCKKVIESGWGQRHPLDGVKFAKYVFGWTIPKEYVLLYAPRTEEEVRILMQVVRASVGYMADTKDVK
ncbi:conserved hypothetical protein [Paecilomyces variotii No. 5]|uniref:Luciferase domain-containing protein n=1 Tax=Byssochlamys spectabilis (strain No. 5 / NBRC 109023) TaxID=1356009 RepID=V5HQV6_BYSSN|nr:conserved hypothetical protein [Paecilomyces variotii No. 5]